jgi:hypothetical protein
MVGWSRGLSEAEDAAAGVLDPLDERSGANVLHSWATVALLSIGSSTVASVSSKFQ